MPLLSIYALALEQDLEWGHGLVQAANTLQTQTYMQVGMVSWVGRGPRGQHRKQPVHLLPPQPLALRRLEHEKRRKEIKEAWHRAQRKLVRPPA